VPQLRRAGGAARLRLFDDGGLSGVLDGVDASTPLLQVLQKIEAEQSRRTPMILWLARQHERRNLGSHRVQTRAVVEDGETFEWEEYLLSPYKGFRYLTQYDGHWNFVSPEAMRKAQPARAVPGFLRRPGLQAFFGRQATTTFVLGEFPWRVRVGEQVVAHDYVNPPWVSRLRLRRMRSRGRAANTFRSAIWKAFQLPGSAPAARGVYLNQPSPMAISRRDVGQLRVDAGPAAGPGDRVPIFSRRNGVSQLLRVFELAAGQPSFVTGDFDLTGRPASLEVAVNTAWTIMDLFQFRSVNEDTGQAYDFGREVSYYQAPIAMGVGTKVRGIPRC